MPHSLKYNVLNFHAVIRFYLHYSIHRTRFLTKSTVNALSHINIIASSSSAPISSGFCFYGNGLKGLVRKLNKQKNKGHLKLNETLAQVACSMVSTNKH